MNWRKCQCGEQLQPSGDSRLVCKKCTSNYELCCKSGHTIRLNSRGLVPKHCSECDVSTADDDEIILTRVTSPQLNDVNADRHVTCEASRCSDPAGTPQGHAVTDGATSVTRPATLKNDQQLRETTMNMMADQNGSSKPLIVADTRLVGSAGTGQMEQTVAEANPRVHSTGPASFADAVKKTRTSDKAIGERGSSLKDSSQNSSRCDTIRVTFFVVVSPSFDFDKERDQVFIKFFAEELGQPYELRSTSVVKDGWTVAVELPRHLATGGRLEYKYFLKRGEIKRFEWIHRRSRDGGVVNRRLNLPAMQDKSITRYDCYDLMMLPEKYDGRRQGTMRRLWNWITGDDMHKALVEDSCNGFEAMMPDILQHDNAAENNCDHALQRIGMVVSRTASSSVFFLDESKTHFNKELMDKAMESYLKCQLEQLETFCKELKSDQDEQKMKSIAGVLLLLIVGERHFCRNRSWSSTSVEFAARIFSTIQWQGVKLDTLRLCLKEQFGHSCQDLQDSLCASVRESAKAGKESWLLAIPLYHMLCSKTNVDLGSINSRTSMFWGMDDKLRDSVEAFKNHVKDLKPDQWFRHLNEVFYQCRLSARTFIAAMNRTSLMVALNSQLELPLDGCIAAVLYHFLFNLKNWETIHKDFHLALTLMVKLVEVTTHSVKKLPTEVLIREAVVACGILMSASGEIFRIPVSMWHCVLLTLELVGRLKAIMDTTACDSKQMHNTDVTSIIDKFGVWLADNFRTTDRNSRGFVEASELEMWESAFSLIWHGTKTQEFWQNKLEFALGNRLGKMSDYAKVECYCRTKFKHPKVEETFGASAVRAAETVMQSHAASELHFQDKESLSKFGRVFSFAFNEAWKVQRSDLEKLTFMLTWPPFPNYINLTCSTHNHVLDEPCKEKVVECVSLLDNKCSELKKGSITYSDLSLLRTHRSNFVKLCHLLEEKKQLSEKVALNIEGWLLLRLEEMAGFDELKSNLRIFCTLCENLDDVQLHDLVSRLDEDVRPKHLNCLWVPQQYSKENARQHLDCLWFPLTKNVLLPAVLSRMKDVHQSILFGSLWKDAHEKHRTENLSNEVDLQNGSVEYVVGCVWPTARDMYDELVQHFRSGQETFEDADKLLQVCKGAQGRDKEIELIAGTKQSAKQISLRIAHYLDIRSSHTAAKIVSKIKNVLQLTGDFSTLDFILGAGVDKQRKLSDISSTHQRAISDLKDLAFEERQRCLDAFVTCRPLVDWVKKEVNDSKELKVFVDLAMIKAGEGDHEVHKVSCLHASVIGYASLIYELTSNAGLNVLLEKCKPLWRNLETNPKLTQQLLDTQKNFEWIKGIKDSYGSVEVTSLAQAAAINERGIYEVGHLRNLVSQKFTLNNVIRVQVMANQNETSSAPRGHRDVKAAGGTVYDYDQLRELQSKLMLVAGKAEQNNPDVETFVSMFRNVIRLATAYLHMHEAGSVLFDHWKARFFGDIQDGFNVHVEFGLSQEVLRGKSDMSCVAHASSLADFMESCIKDWNGHVAQQRLEFPELNHFTMKQIVYLRQQLGKLRFSESTDPKVYPMLAMLEPTCSQSGLRLALANAEHMMHEMQGLPLKPEAVTSDENSLSAEQLEIIDEIVGFQIDRQLAMAAVRDYPDYDTLELIEWCQANGGASLARASACNDSEDIADTIQPVAKSSLQLNAIINNLVNIESSSSNVSSLAMKLTSLWQNFLQQASVSIVDFLSVKHLGYVLRCLAGCSGSAVKKRARTVPYGLDRGKPHLIVCPHDKVLSAALSLYLCDSEWPMPTRNELLVCTDATSFEDVELFLERALADELSVYCLIHAHRLSYDICGHVEKKLEASLQAEKNHFVAVVCAEESDSHSRMVAALDRFRSRNFRIEPVERVKAYVLKNLQSASPGVSKTASSLDFEGCCTRVVCSERAGVGKTLLVKRTFERMEHEVQCRSDEPLIAIQLVQQEVDVGYVLGRLLSECCEPLNHKSRIVHINVSQEVRHGVDELLFDLLILGSLCQQDGFIWQRSLKDYYIIEAIHLKTSDKSSTRNTRLNMHSILDLLPAMECLSPIQCRQYYEDIRSGRKKAEDAHHVLMDKGEFQSIPWQRTYQYLSRLDQNRQVKDVNPKRVEGSPLEMLTTLIRHCGIGNPSWSELRHFVHFLNSQLHDCEVSAFCSAAANEDLPGFFEFVIKFMLQMSRDFATRSLQISEEPPLLQVAELQDSHSDELLHGMVLKRRWESSPHPYLFFNPDHHTITFLGFYVDQRTGNILDPQTSKVLETSAVPQQLLQALLQNKVDLAENFDAKSRFEKISKICAVMGNNSPHDPDDTYELTTDNVKKILAIQMRFRCSIPVVIMGETGCGKTRLIRFMCDLQVPKGVKMTNMILMKIHGGVTKEQVITKVQQAYKLAKVNKAAYPHVDTVLFLDEANTTDAIGLIKEIMCDGSLDGIQLDVDTGLRVIAAVNPYRKHPTDMIKKLESAGLGYHVHADRTTDRFGTIPMRQLVYRVRALPLGMLPLVWDFGQLSADVEEAYIGQMIQKYVASRKLPTNPAFKDAVAKVLVKCQEFMRSQKDECSFVSLRDIDRVLLIMSWFYSKHQLLSTDDSGKKAGSPGRLNVMTWSMVLALGACYHACLQPENRLAFRRMISRHFKKPLELGEDGKQMLCEIEKCQSLIIESLRSQIAENIAHNQALKENLFMMVLCMELRIPLFLVGKPGSSKSLAKAILAIAMQGEASDSELFKQLKQTHMVSFQCSPLATPEGIVGTFKQCARLQKSHNLDNYVSVVVLDEIGLAEDSKRMPLKTLHPLLEDGCDGDEEPAPYMKCAFIGISNWALDPAKMNRGILVQRGVPDKKELINSARGICQFDEHALASTGPLISQLAAAYLDIFKYSGERREFFGLRDFYSLMKMVAYFASKNKGMPHPSELRHAVLRNFGGLDDRVVVDLFEKHLGKNMDVTKDLYGPEYPPCDTIGLIDSSLSGAYTQTGGESRYLLFLTENYTALNLIQNKIQRLNPTIIFGSNFPKDLEYTQVCRNINRIKVCMETGTPVMLLNLENLYESLYDALNQYYVYLGGRRFVDIGLGTHRVKCQVDEKFRLIVVAIKDVVYQRFPIPLINRLEKHYIAMSTVLNSDQADIVRRLEDWATDFVSNRLQHMHPAGKPPLPEDAFVGYATDTAATVILQVVEELSASFGLEVQAEMILAEAQYRLLLLATPDAVLRVQNSRLSSDYEKINDVYYNKQQHESLGGFLLAQLEDDGCEDTFVQVTTRSTLLAKEDVSNIEKQLQATVAVDVSIIEALQAIETEQQFTKEMRSFYGRKRLSCTFGSGINSSQTSLLIVQCEDGHDNLDLIACARYIISREHNGTVADKASITSTISPAPHNASNEKPPRLRFIVVLLIQLNKSTAFHGFHGGKWTCIHIDDLRPQKDIIPAVSRAQHISISELLDCSLEAHQRQGSLYLEGQSGGHRTAANLTKGETFDVFGLLRSCLHEAASRLRDTTDSSARRLHALHNIFAATGNVQFQQLFLRCLVVLLRQRENQVMTPQMATCWLSSEAAAISNVAKSGTFRRSFEDCLEKKIAPFFAAIVAYCDTNDNFDLLNSTDVNEQSWAPKFWLSVFDGMISSSSDLALFVSNMQTKFNRAEVPVVCNSASGRRFSPRFPFSWVLKQKMDAAVAQSYADQDVPALLSTIIQNDSDIGRQLATLSLDDLDKAVLSFARDYLYMSHRCLSEDELLILLKTLLSAMANRNMNTVVGVHVCYGENQHIFHRFNRVLDLVAGSKRTEIVTKLREGSESGPRVENDCSVAIDLAALHAVLMSLEASCRVNFTTELSQEVQRCHTIAEEILKIYDGAGPDVRDMVQSCRHMWNRLAAVRLFVEHVILASQQASTTSCIFELRDASAMHKMLSKEKDFDFKRLSSLETLEKYLRICNHRVISTIYGNDVTTKVCFSCGKTMKEPVLLPCRHVICNSCLWREFRLSKQSQTSTVACPKCKNAIPVGYAYSPSDEGERAKYKQHQSFKQFFNVYFIRILSDLVFGGTGQPEPPVLRHILSYVTLDIFEGQTSSGDGDHGCPTKQISPYTDVSLIDPTPVIRSFLLRLLLQSSKGTVDGYVTEYFNLCQSITGRVETSAHIELCCLFVNCMEDYKITELNSAALNDLSRVYMTTEDTLSASARGFITSTLRKGGPAWCTFNGLPFALTSDSLGTIADVRLSLIMAADFICKKTARRNNGLVPADFTEIVDVLQQMFDHAEKECGCFSLRRLLTKQIIQKHGASSIHAALAVPSLGWILPKDVCEAAAAEALIDFFVIENKLDAYLTLRNALSACIIEGKIDAFDQCFQAVKQQNAIKSALLAMTVCSVVTRSYFNHGPTGIPKPETMKMLVNYVSLLPHITSKDFSMKLLSNSLPGELKLEKAAGLRNAMVALLVCRLWILLVHQQPNVMSLISPLSELITNVQSMKDKFLPTMPHDQLQDVKEIMMSVKTTAYACPKGHPYYIGECGKPVTEGKCPTCASVIGGTLHAPAAGNSLLDLNKDSTKHGHVLGPVNSVSPGGTAAVAERDLSPAACTVIRAILHMTMYASAAVNGPEKVGALIDPKPVDVPGFLWLHIFNDLTSLQYAIGKSFDDCVMFLHAIIGNLPTAVAQDGCQWDTQLGRRKWEASVQSSLIARFIQNCGNEIAAARASVRADSHQSSSTAALTQLLREEEVPTELGSVLLNPAVWRYRESPSIEQMAIRLENLCSNSAASKGDGLPSADCREATGDRYACLQKFLRIRHSLAAIRYLPDIVALTALLHQEYGHRLDASTVASLTIESFMSIHGNRCIHALRPLIQNFIKAWNAVHDNLRHHRFWFHGRECLAPEDACALPMTTDSPLRMLLAGRRGLALCSVALATYLGNLHNDFRDLYTKASKQQPSYAVSLPNVRVSHVIAVDLQADLFPIMLANCEYSLKVGEGTLLQYNFDAIQHQLLDHFVCPKPRLLLPGHVSNANELHEFLLREDVTHGRQLEKLCRIIPQELMHADMRDKIVTEYRGQVAELAESLVLIDQIIGFLVATNVPDDMQLWKYMHNVLHMDPNARAYPVLKNCWLHHVKALWLLLSLERTKVLAKSQQQSEMLKNRASSAAATKSLDQYTWQDWFIGIDERYSLPPPEYDSLKLAITSLPHVYRMQATNSVLEILYEFIVLKLSTMSDGKPDNAETDDDDAFQPHFPLFQSLSEYAGGLRSDGTAEQCSDAERVVSYLQQLAIGCSHLQLQHAVPTWVFILDTSLRKSGVDAVN